MGNLCCDSDNRMITSYMSKEESRESKQIKLLLLGPGSAGKTTIFKSLQMVHSGGTMSMETKREHIDLIRFNILDGIVILMKQSNVLFSKNSIKYKGCQFNDKDGNLQNGIEFVMSHASPDIIDSNEMSQDTLKQLMTHIKTLWKLPCIQETYKNRENNFAIADNLTYFFDKLETIFDSNYLPSENDCLLNRMKTTGIIEYQYSIYNQIFTVVDVGGQRTERRKWLNCFDSVRGLLFVGSLISYLTVLYEDNGINGIYETVCLFEDLINRACFDECNVILLLNKDDLLREKLKETSNGLLKCFSKDGQWPNENEYWDGSIDEKYWPFINDFGQFEEYHSLVVNFIAQLFLKRNKNKERSIYCHTTIAIQNEIIRDVFDDIQMSILQNNANAVGFGDITSSVTSAPSQTSSSFVINPKDESATETDIPIYGTQ